MASISSKDSSQTGAQPSPPANLRFRPLGRSASAVLAEHPPTPGLRRASTFSDTVSEARQSIKSSTDDLFLPRVDERARTGIHDPESPWQSTPLALALLPALGGLFFTNGSAVLTDISLLVLAAVFLNWSVRLPWDWYHSAQGVGRGGIPRHERFEVNEFGEEQPIESDSHDDKDEKNPTGERHPPRPVFSSTQAHAIASARAQLRLHEVIALASCFICPVAGAWLLHTIRAQLSRPSEGLVSNYNLTVFLLAAEIRPVSHLLKMVQSRTLYLQRIVASNPYEEEKLDSSKVLDLSKRLEELEAHIAESLTQNNSLDDQPPQATASGNQQQIKEQLTEATARISTDVCKTMQPDLDALNRAVRRYEKRTAVSNYEIDARIRELERQMRDVISLATDAQRKRNNNSSNIRGGSVVGGGGGSLLNWMIAMVLLPAQVLWMGLTVFLQTVSLCLRVLGEVVGYSSASSLSSSSSSSLNHNRKQVEEGIGSGNSIGGSSSSAAIRASPSSSSSQRIPKRTSTPTATTVGSRFMRPAV
ncbi:hypothetical protein AJ80_08299 [Polytolypa hystricis UAMH7299]|uniref:Uncharacterized protein n=1 Tax=Polytolypa hystricis (strain UAMH7299) TaxID=1447883 RepID=A0A2B7XAI6_POLH7|nr:hypothetical protein AJ80_08299 [Polytolypa hystricis UAMH7299]